MKRRVWGSRNELYGRLLFAMIVTILNAITRNFNPFGLLILFFAVFLIVTLVDAVFNIVKQLITRKRHGKKD